jgi:hypothetical protein
MKYNLFLIFILFIINFALHLISEKVVIITFVIILYLLINLLGKLITADYSSKIKALLQDIHTYINAIFVILYTKKHSLLSNLYLTQLFKNLSLSLMLNVKEALYVQNIKKFK